MLKTETVTVADLIFVETKPILEIKIDYPQIQGFMPDSSEKRINAFFETDAKRQNRYARGLFASEAKKAYLYSKENAFPFHLWSYLQTFEETFSGKLLWSLFLDRYQYSGGAHGQTTRRGFVFSLKTGRRMTLSEVSALNRSEILKIVRKEISESGEGVYFDNAPALASRFFHPENFYLTSEGLVVFYPSGTLGPYVSGIRTFLIPASIKE